MSEQTGELAVVIFEQEADGEWHPTQVFTRRWIKFHDGREGWTYNLFDGSWCRRDERLHLYKSGGGPPYVEGCGSRDGVPVAARLWLADGERVRGTAGEAYLTPEQLTAMGYELVTEHPGDIFSGASDEPTTWCEECKDNIPRYENPCEHLATCWHCQASYTAEGDEERRCPDCNESQHECDYCDEQGAETCISCGQWLCKTCWPGHPDEGGIRGCERSAPDWKEPA